MQKLYKASEVAQLLMISIKTLERWEKEGWLQPIRFIKHRKFYTEEHIELIRRMKG